MKKKESMIRKEKREGFIDIICEAKGLKRKDGIIYCPTVPLIEGVYDGWGIPVLREFKEFSKDAKWLMGLPVLTNHEELTPEARRIGQMTNPLPRPESRDVSTITQFYEIDLTQREIDEIVGASPLNGSMSFSCWIAMESGDWTDPKTGAVKHYEAREEGPYIFYEYSKVKHGVVTPDDGAGFNMECRGCKSKSHSQSSAPGGADMDEAQIKEMIEEAQKPLKGQIATLEQKNTTLEGELKGFKEQAEKRREIRQKAMFASKLKPAFLTQEDTLWAECKEIGYLAFEAKHPEMIIQPAQERKLKGSALISGDGQGWSLEQERAKLKAEGKVI